MSSRWSWTIVAGIVAVASLLALAVLSRNAVRGASAAEDVSTRPARLYYQDEGWLWSVTLGAHRTRKRLVRVGYESGGLAVTPRYIFWMSLTAPGGQSLYRFRRDGTHRVRLVGKLDSPSGVIAVGSRVYWLDGNAIGTVNADGSGVRRKLVVPSQEYGGGVGDGLASDGRYLYFSRGQERSIARVRLDSGLSLRYIVLGDKHGPLALTYAAGYLYWSDVDHNFLGVIGRASLDGRLVAPEWLHIGKPPFDVVAGGGVLFWVHGAVAGQQEYVGRASARGRITTHRFVRGVTIALGP
jgi:hypothetical protein